MGNNDKTDLPERMDRSIVSYGNQKKFDEEDRAYWQNAPVAEKLQTITYLRECFYGKEATTKKKKKTYTLFNLMQRKQQ
jgi:hypothetical protein